MRHFMMFGLALIASFAMIDSADAKKPKKGEEPVAEETKAPEEPMSLEIQTTGVADVDNLFGKAVEPLKTLRGANESLSKMNTDLAAALGLAEGTPFADALNDLKTKAEGKIKISTNVKIVGSAPDELTALTEQLKNVTNTITSTFSAG
jgi:hypothetical protein